MNVTKEIQKNNIVYGASDYTAPAGLAASKSLNYAKGASILKPIRNEVTVIPHTISYADSVGLFGAENYFVRVDLDVIEEITKSCYEEIGWECAQLNPGFVDLDPNYVMAVIDTEKDLDTENTYEPASISGNTLPKLREAYLSIELVNIKTGNRFLDDWLDIRLYTSEREEHASNKMYVKVRDHFYIGVHARNTRRLPYDIRCIIGREYRSYDSIEDKRLIMRKALR